MQQGSEAIVNLKMVGIHMFVNDHLTHVGVDQTKAEQSISEQVVEKAGV